MTQIIGNSPINPEDIEPAEILIAIHKRIVQCQKDIAAFRAVLNDTKIELEMAVGRITELEQKSCSDCECKKRSKNFEI